MACLPQSHQRPLWPLPSLTQPSLAFLGAAPAWDAHSSLSGPRLPRTLPQPPSWRLPSPSHMLFQRCLRNEKRGYLLKCGGPPTTARSIPQAHLLCPTAIVISHRSPSLASSSHCSRFVCLPPQECRPLAAEIPSGIFTNGTPKHRVAHTRSSVSVR